MIKESICFVILNYNCAEETQHLVDTLNRWDGTALDYRIVVVDNCSTDNSFKVLSSLYRTNQFVDVIQSEKNGGYSYGNNYGSRYAKERYNPNYIAIANPDVQIEENTVAELLKTFHTDDSIAMVAPVMKSINGDYAIASQSLPKYYDDFRACWTEKNPPSVNKDSFQTLPNHQYMILIEMLPGSFFVVRTDYFFRAGLFDENVFLFCEERIIGARMKELGYKLILRIDLFFVHAHSVSIKKAMDTVKTWKILWRSRIYYQIRYNKISKTETALLKMCSWLFIRRLAILLYLHELKTAMIGA